MYHRDLDLWKTSIELVKVVYGVLDGFPRNEEYALSSQIRRAAVSIPSNIAEGCGRGTNKELYRFLDIASGSLAELETQIYIAKELGYISDSSEVDDLIVTVQKILVGFKKRIKTEILKNNPDCAI
jgi:four helix bundle protein